MPTTQPSLMPNQAVYQTVSTADPSAAKSEDEYAEFVKTEPEVAPKLEPADRPEPDGPA